MTIEQALEGCERILSGEFDEHPESALYMIGDINDAISGHKAPKTASDEAHHAG